MNQGASQPSNQGASRPAARRKRIAIFGSTGSIGTQALDVIREHPELFEVSILTAHSNHDLLIEQSIRFKPHTVVIGEERRYEAVRDALTSHGIRVLAGVEALEEAAADDDYDMMLAAIVGFAGLKPTLRAIDQGKAIALASSPSPAKCPSYPWTRNIQPSSSVWWERPATGLKKSC
jgi:1-deoxy-D-xylulose-5-phosphate reductoisomerase